MASRILACYNASCRGREYQMLGEVDENSTAYKPLETRSAHQCMYGHQFHTDIGLQKARFCPNLTKLHAWSTCTPEVNFLQLNVYMRKSIFEGVSPSTCRNK